MCVPPLTFLEILLRTGLKAMPPWFGGMAARGLSHAAPFFPETALAGSEGEWQERHQVRSWAPSCCRLAMICWDQEWRSSSRRVRWWDWKTTPRSSE